jgi:peptidoglycan/xylan/chitin deacetylase (PgdA/CDA1 family)
MKQALKSLITLPAQFLATRPLLAFSGTSLVLPFYHVVSDQHLPHVAPLYRYKNVREFELDIDQLLRHFQPVSLAEVEEHTQTKKPFTKPSFHLSFDDGLREVQDIIFPVLQQKGITATVFVNPAFVGNQDLFFRYKVALLIAKLNTLQTIPTWSFNNHLKTKEAWKTWLLQVKHHQEAELEELAKLFKVVFSDFLQNQKPYLDLAELQNLEASGWNIGAHSMTHPLYGLIPLEEQLMQTAESMQWVHEHFPNQPNAFAFPFSDLGVSETFFNKLALYTHSPHILFGTSGLKKEQHPMHLQRIAMEETNQSAEEIVKTELWMNGLKRLAGKDLIKRPLLSSR